MALAYPICSPSRTSPLPLPFHAHSVLDYCMSCAPLSHHRHRLKIVPIRVCHLRHSPPPSPLADGRVADIGYACRLRSRALQYQFPLTHTLPSSASLPSVCITFRSYFFPFNFMSPWFRNLSRRSLTVVAAINPKEPDRSGLCYV
jgi:hypothetical protein